jgi:hypothetical protein
MKRGRRKNREPLTNAIFERRQCRAARRRTRERARLNAVAAAGRAATSLAPRLRERVDASPACVNDRALGLIRTKEDV